MAEKVKPGEIVRISGQYSNGKYETTLVAGKPAPPTQKPGQSHKLVDKTKHKK